jgi:hypothetical protein
MLFRTDGETVIAIPQPSHAWLAGQIVRAWGNERFPRPAPYEEVCLGAEQHDIAWLRWEAEPTWNPETCLPHAFLELPVARRTEDWSRGVQAARTFGRYPALIVSLHTNTIYAWLVDNDALAPADTAAIRGLLAEQHAFQHAMREQLATDPLYAEHATPEALERNRLLVAAADRMSLAICWGVGESEIEIPYGPFVLRAPRRDPENLVLGPWPFAADRLEVLGEGRRLRGPFPDLETMRAAYAEAPAVPIRAMLRPA